VVVERIPAIEAEDMLGVRVLTVRGELDISHAAELQVLLRDAVWRFDGNVLVDLGAALFVDASTLSALARMSLKMRRDGRRLALLRASSLVRRFLSITQLDSRLPVYDNFPVALDALAPDEADPASRVRQRA
jgi:anti-anti-sigma factor